jgi:hypothetical protein
MARGRKSPTLPLPAPRTPAYRRKTREQAHARQRLAAEPVRQATLDDPVHPAKETDHPRRVVSDAVRRTHTDCTHVVA